MMLTAMGEDVSEPMTVRQLAEATGRSKSYIYDAIGQGYLRVDETKRPMMVVGGYVPLTNNAWIGTLWNRIPWKMHHLASRTWPSPDGQQARIEILDGATRLRFYHEMTLEGMRRQAEQIDDVVARWQRRQKMV